MELGTPLGIPPLLLLFLHGHAPRGGRLLVRQRADAGLSRTALPGVRRLLRELPLFYPVPRGQSLLPGGSTPGPNRRLFLLQPGPRDLFARRVTRGCFPQHPRVRLNHRSGGGLETTATARLPAPPDGPGSHCCHRLRPLPLRAGHDRRLGPGGDHHLSIHRLRLANAKTSIPTIMEAGKIAGIMHSLG